MAFLSQYKGSQIVPYVLAFLFKAEQGYMCEKFGVVLFNPYISSENIYIQMQGLVFVGERQSHGHGMLILFSVGSGSDSWHAGVGHTTAFSINTWN